MNDLVNLYILTLSCCFGVSLPSILTMSYQLYRSMSLGESLKAALDDLIENQLITPDLAVKVN